MPIRNFYSVLSNDLEATAKWYVDLFGYNVEFSSDWFVHLQAPQNNMIELGIMSSSHEIVPERCRGRPAGGMLTIVVDDVDETLVKAKATGIDIFEEPRDLFYGQRRMLLVDPNGLMVDVSSECPPDPAWLATLGG